MVSKARKAAAQASYQQGQRKNFIINGDMAICQRATSASSLGATSGYHVLDRWRLSLGGSNTVRFTMSQDSETPDGFANSMKLDCTTAETNLGDSTSDYVIVEQRLEGLNLQTLNKGDSDARALNVSFSVRSPKTGVHTVTLYDTSNTRAISTTYTIASANTWENHSVSFAGDTSGAIPDDNTEGLTLWFWLMASTDYTSGTFNTSWASHVAANACNSSQVNVFDSTDNNFYLTGVQMELGNTATEFQYETYVENLQRCQRYFYIVSGSNITSQARPGIYGYLPISLPVQMRANPTLSAGWPTPSGVTGVSTGAQITKDIINANAYKSGSGFYFTVPDGSTASAEL